MGRLPCCSICMEIFRDFTDLAAGCCGHTFHQSCLKSWMDKCDSRRQSPACPHCLKRFEYEPATGIIDCLYFALIEESATSESDDLLVQQQLREEIAGRDAEIRQLQTHLRSLEEGKDRAEKSVIERTRRLNLVQF